MKRIIYLVPLLFAFSAKAQFNLGVTTGNWCAYNSVYLNPANIAEAREKKSVSLGSFCGGVDNNVGPLNVGEGLVVAVGDGKANNMFRYTNNSKVSMTAPYVDIAGPGLMVKVDKKHSFAISSRIRGMNQFSNFDQTLFHTFNDPTFRTDKDVLSNQQNFNYTVHLWAEVAFSYAATVFDNGKHKLKVGATARYLGGIAYVGVRGRNMDVKFSTGLDTFYAGNVDLDYASNILKTKSSEGSNISQSFFSLLYKGNFGHGIGGDLGVVYEYRPDGEKKKGSYKAKFNAALCDIGSIHYSGNINASEHFTGNGYVTGPSILKNVKNMDDIGKYAVSRGFNAEIRRTAEKLYMPMHLIFGGDYFIAKKYYANLTFLINLANRKNLGNFYYNQFTLTPRYETKNISVGLPITYSTLSHRFKTGVGLMAGGFFIGSDDMLSFLLKSEYGVNFYMGLNVPIYK